MVLTRRQKEIYEFVRSFLDREGYAPSLEEIAAGFGLSSVATVHKHIQNLVDKGLLRKAWNRSRSLELVEQSSDSVRIGLLGRVAIRSRSRPTSWGAAPASLSRCRVTR
jgi:repressor LexA